jgi:hypothetical protein
MFFVLATLALVTMACGITINIPIPVDEIAAGPTRTKEIVVREPDASVADLTLVFGAGELSLEPGADEDLVSGTATFNVEDFEPKIDVDGEKVRIETGDLEIKGIPDFGNDIKNEWELALGDMPMNLTINAGAYQGDLELGGLSLKSLEIGDGAANVRVKFSEPNKVEMESLRYTTGASNVEISGLANANFTSLIFRSGAGDYTLDFSGKLLQDAVAVIESGISQMAIVVSEDTNARVIFKGGLTSVSASSEWSKSGDTYVLEGDGPTLTINVDMGAGNLQLRAE